MRQRLFSIPLLGATLIATACTMPLSTTVSPQATGATPRVTRAPAATGLLEGLVRGPAGIVAAGGANVVAPGGGNLIGPAGGNLIGPAGGNLQGATRGLLALEEGVLEGVEVFVADAAGKPIPGLPSVRTNAKGQFSIPKVPAGFTYVVVARVETAAGEAASLKTLAKATTLGTTVDLDMANTLVTTAVVNGREDALGEFNAATFQRAVETTAKHLDPQALPDLADSSAVLTFMTALAEDVTELKSAVTELKSMLAKVSERLDELEAAIKDRNAASAAPSASPSGAPTAPPVVATAPPTPAPTAQPTAAPGVVANDYTVSTLAGSGFSGTADGVGSAAQFFNMRGIGLDGAGNVFVADTANNRIRKIAADGTVTTLAGTAGAGALDGAAAVAKFNAPNDVAFEGTGALFVTDGGNNRVRQVALDGTTSTLAGSAYGTVDATGTAAKFRTPRGVTFVGGLLYVADTASSAGTKLRTLTPDGTADTIAGSLLLDGMLDVAADAAGNVYAVMGHQVVRIGADKQLTVIAGGTQGASDGTGAAAQFNKPEGIARDAAGNLYIADSGNHRIRKITPAGVVTTIAGTSSGYADGASSAAKFNEPLDIEYDEATRKLYVSERKGQRVRVLSPL